MKTWTVKISVSDNWIKDGFVLRSDKLHEVVSELLPYAYPEEIIVKVKGEKTGGNNEILS